MSNSPVAPTVNHTYVTTHTTWRRFITGVVLFALVVGLVLVLEQDRSSPTVSMPATGAVSVTGYAHMSAAFGSTDSTTVTLTSAQATALRQAISTLPRFANPEGRPAVCAEQDTVFTISVARTQGEAANWAATADLCPAPGLLYFKDAADPQRVPVRYCNLKEFITSIFPKGVVAGTLAGLKFCDTTSHS
jgi:hypothetical protein